MDMENRKEPKTEPRALKNVETSKRNSKQVISEVAGIQQSEILAQNPFPGACYIAVWM